jgi:hypothetical protein
MDKFGDCHAGQGDLPSLSRFATPRAGALQAPPKLHALHAAQRGSHSLLHEQLNSPACFLRVTGSKKVISGTCADPDHSEEVRGHVGRWSPPYHASLTAMEAVRQYTALIIRRWGGVQAWGNKGYPAPPLRKHAESQQNDGNTGSCA